MSTLIGIFVIGFVIFLIFKSARNLAKKKYKIDNKSDLSFNLLNIEKSNESKSTEIIKFKPIKQDSEGYWILNPGTTFELTLLSTDQRIAQALRDFLDKVNFNSYYSEITDEILVLFLSNDLQIKEIEEYKKKYKVNYLKNIETQKNKSKEWNIASNKDKEDLLIEYNEIAVKEIYERCNEDFNYQIFFEWTSSEAFNFDLELIKEYGFQNIDNYIRNYIVNPGKIYVLPYDKKQRPEFEKLVKIGLADNGYNLTKIEIMNILSLKELNELAGKTGKEFKRKNQAIEYLLTLENLGDRLGQKIALRELFKLKSLPNKYSEINFSEILTKWEYYYSIIYLLKEAYNNSKDAIIAINGQNDSDLYKREFEIDIH